MIKKLIITIFLVMFLVAGCTYHQTFEEPPPSVEPPLTEELEPSVDPPVSVKPVPVVKPKPHLSGGAAAPSANPPSNYDTPGTGGGGALDTY